MTTEEVRRIFRFRARMNMLSDSIARTERSNGSAQALRCERASLNLAMMEGYGVCVDLSINELVAFEEGDPIRENWIAQLEGVARFERGTYLQEVLRAG